MNKLFTVTPIKNNKDLKIIKMAKTPSEIIKYNKNVKEHMYLLDIKKNKEEIKKIIKTMHQFNTVELNVKQVNDSWKKTTKYIPENFIDVNNQYKYLLSRKDLFNGDVVSVPEIFKNKDGNFEFYNGRHRFANLRDLGCDKCYFKVFF